MAATDDVATANPLFPAPEFCLSVLDLLFLAPSWKFSAFLVCGTGFVPPAIARSCGGQNALRLVTFLF